MNEILIKVHSALETTSNSSYEATKFKRSLILSIQSAPALDQFQWCNCIIKFWEMYNFHYTFWSFHNFNSTQVFYLHHSILTHSTLPLLMMTHLTNSLLGQLKTRLWQGHEYMESKLGEIFLLRKCISYFFLPYFFHTLDLFILIF